MKERRVTQVFQSCPRESQLLTDIERVFRDALCVAGGVLVLGLDGADEHLNSRVVCGLEFHEGREGLAGDDGGNDQQRKRDWAKTAVELTDHNPQKTEGE